jgi:lysophospholipase L1-like esterase
MNLLPDAVSILCYGDSNTYGQKPDRSGRFNANERWPGVLQAALGEEFYVIEEGLGGRTTNLDHPNPNKPSRNGFTYFAACLESHSPLDIVIIMLGTNDFKTVYNRATQDITEALKQYIDRINLTYEDALRKPKVLLVSPPYMDDDAPQFYTSMPTPGVYDQTSIQKSHELALTIKELAHSTGSYFFDSAQVAQTGEDGVHITKLSHSKLGKDIAAAVQSMST